MPISAQRIIKPGTIRNFGHYGDAAEVPNLTDVQTRSYERFLQLPLAPDEARQGERQIARRALVGLVRVAGTGFAGPLAEGRLQPGAVGDRQVQRPRQLAESVRIGGLSRAALQVADGAGAHARPLGQRLLRQPGCQSEASEQRAEGRRRLNRHRWPPH